MQNILKGAGLKPLILSLPELKRVLGPLTVGYVWGESTIKDLFSQCAPVPGFDVERRIISPAHLGAWLADVLERQGLPLDVQAQTYNNLVTGVTHNGRRN